MLSARKITIFAFATFVANFLPLSSNIAYAETNKLDAISQRLLAVEDRLAIERLMAIDYAMAVDTKNWKAFGALFVDDGEFVMLSGDATPTMAFKGRNAIENAFTGPPPAKVANIPEDKIPVSSKVIVTTPRINISGTSAKATAFWIDISVKKDGSTIVGSTGYYLDDFVKIGGNWFFKKRVVHDYDMPEMRQFPLPK